MQPITGSGERALNLLVAVALGEYEAQVLVPFGEGPDMLAEGNGDGEAGDSGHRRGFGAAVNRAQHAGPLDGKHEHARGPGQPAWGHMPAQGAGQYQLLQALPVSEPQRP